MTVHSEIVYYLQSLPPSALLFLASLRERIVKTSWATKYWALYLYFLMQSTQSSFGSSGDKGLERVSVLPKITHLLVQWRRWVWTHITGTLHLSVPACCFCPSAQASAHPPLPPPEGGTYRNTSGSWKNTTGNHMKNMSTIQLLERADLGDSSSDVFWKPRRTIKVKFSLSWNILRKHTNSSHRKNEGP